MSRRAASGSPCLYFPSPSSSSCTSLSPCSFTLSSLTSFATLDAPLHAECVCRALELLSWLAPLYMFGWVFLSFVVLLICIVANPFYSNLLRANGSTLSSWPRSRCHTWHLALVHPHPRAQCFLTIWQDNQLCGQMGSTLYSWPRSRCHTRIHAARAAFICQHEGSTGYVQTYVSGFLPFFVNFFGPCSIAVPPWLAPGAVQSVSAFANAGLSLLDDNLISFQAYVPYLLFVMLLILVGNTMYAATLRFLLHIIARLGTEQQKLVAGYLLDHPRKCYTHLFPPSDTRWLLITILIFNSTEFIFFCALDWNSPALTGLTGATHYSTVFFIC